MANTLCCVVSVASYVKHSLHCGRSVVLAAGASSPILGCS